MVEGMAMGDGALGNQMSATQLGTPVNIMEEWPRSGMLSVIMTTGTTVASSNSGAETTAEIGSTVASGKRPLSGSTASTISKIWTAGQTPKRGLPISSS